MADIKIKVRKYEEKDRPFVREIACATAFIGKDAGAFFEDREILADTLTTYFTDYEPESCFVAESQGDIIGYIIGAKDEATLNKTQGTKIAKQLFIKALTSRVLLRNKNTFFLFRCLLSLLKGEFRQPDFYKDYPAILHINLKEGFRGLGIGAQLMHAYLGYLKENEIKGVHLATMSDETGAFFSKQGFGLLFSAKRSYFRHILHQDIAVYIYGRRL